MPVNMKKENVLPSNFRHLNGPITRAAALRASGKMAPLKVSTKQNRKRILQANSKGAALDDNSANGRDNAGNQHKRRAVLQDVTNVCCENSYTCCFSATKIQAKISKQAKKGQLNVSKVATSVGLEHQRLKAISKKKIVCQEVKIEPDSEVVCSSTSEKDIHSKPSGIRGFGTDDTQPPNQCSRVHSHPHNSPKKEECSIPENWKISDDREFIDIDSGQKDPLLCSLYAADIYSNLRVAELVRRSLPTFMETVQKDITQSMRGILVDWLVELDENVRSPCVHNMLLSMTIPVKKYFDAGSCMVSEEYKLVTDTLYLTVYLIDWFLSQNYIERQRLQLLGITCMLIASKYEEICSPHVEEFCFITDNTYTSLEVLRMETKVLNFFGFQVFAPTAKTFLRRFLHAAQASYKNPSYELEYLANYLAELTLVEYGFLNFLPSVIAASSVFLARWTLDQTSHPWSPTLEHYTSYKASDLKTTVLALQDLQLNTNGCPLNAIRMKYRQPKFKSVAALSSPRLLETLF